MLRRLLAVGFALLVLFVAFQIRASNEQPGEDGGTARPGVVDPYDVFDDGDVRLLCIDELRAVCEDALPLLEIDVDGEPAWTTVDRLRDGGDLGADAWLTVRPLDQEVRAGGGAAPQSTPVLGRSPILLAASPAAMGVADAACTD